MRGFSEEAKAALAILVLWAAVITAYLVLSLVTEAWWITWILPVAGVFVQQIIRAYIRHR